MRTPTARLLLVFSLLCLLTGAPATAGAAFTEPAAVPATHRMSALTLPDAVSAAPAIGIQVPLPAVTFTVNSAGDEPDANTADNLCATAAGDCTLRAAIQQANARTPTSGIDSIVFAINPGVGPASFSRDIAVSSSLPSIGVPLSISGPNSDGRIVLIDGFAISNTAESTGLTVSHAQHVTIRNLRITNFGLAGIRIANSSYVTLTGNAIGFPSTALFNPVNAGNFYGVSVVRSQNIVIGVPGTARNVISNNTIGIQLYNSDENTIQTNYIGLNLDGTAAAPNSLDGVRVRGSRNLVGGSAADARNIISGNGHQGIIVMYYDEDVTVNHRPVYTNTISGNYIGLNAAGTAAVPNGRYGVWVQGGYLSGADNGLVQNTLIGGTSAGQRNIISGNTLGGVRVSNIVGQASAVDTRLHGNYIGTSPDGLTAIPNGMGVSIESAVTTAVGGMNAGEANLIAGNLGTGVELRSAPINTLVVANRIGLNAAGAPLGNAGHGVSVLTQSPGTIIGGMVEGTGNTIAHNLGAGVAYTSTAVIMRNGIYQNGGLGLDYGGRGVTPNDYPLGGGNDYDAQNYPVLSRVVVSGTTATFIGAITTTRDITITLEFFVSGGYDPSGHGEGQVWVGARDIRVGSSGVRFFTETITLADTRAGVYTATATDKHGWRTSEFSAAPHRLNIPAALR